MATIYAAQICPFAHRATIALFEAFPMSESNGYLKGVDYVEIDLQNKPANYAEIHPELKVPAFQFTDAKGKKKILIESLLIAEYVLEAYAPSASSLIPKDPLSRYEMRLFISNFGNSIIPGFYKLLKAQTPDLQKAATDDLLTGFHKLNEDLHETGPFALGEHFTLADIATIPWICRLAALEHYRNFTIPKTHEFARFHAWSKACLERKSVKMTEPERELSVSSYESYAKPSK